MTHTPGPWMPVDAEWLMSQRTGMGFRYFPVRAAGQTWDIANVFSDEDDSEMAANARLIAAAPELLAALKNHLPWQEEPVQGWGLWKDAVDAIAKAEGRE
jgi:hypothetical protein